MPPPAHVDLNTIDFSKVLAGRDEIDTINPQRFEMCQLTAVVLLDLEKQLIAGYRDVGHDEFWARGHMPGFPLFPGVLMIESAAQLSNFLMKKLGFRPGELVGLGGVENSRFRGPVRPGDRLDLVGKAKKVDRRQTIVDVQGFVGTSMVFHVDIIGVPIPGTDKMSVKIV